MSAFFQERPTTSQQLLFQLVNGSPWTREYIDTRFVPIPADKPWAGGVNVNRPDLHQIMIAPDSAEDPWVVAHELGHLASQQKYKDYIPVDRHRIQDIQKLRVLGQLQALEMEKEADLRALRYLTNAGYGLDQLINKVPARSGQSAIERQQWLKDQRHKMGL